MWRAGAQVLWASLLAHCTALAFAASDVESLEQPVCEAPNDTIIIDGRPVRVAAEVRFDTLQRLPRHGAWQWAMGPVMQTRQVAGGGEGFAPLGRWRFAQPGGTPPSSSRENDWGGWTTLASPALWTAEGGGMRLHGVAGWDWGQSLRVEGLSALMPEDSVVGFVALDASTVGAITYAEYDIGVETDTLPLGIVATPRHAVSLGARVDWAMAQRDAGALSLSVGAWMAVTPVAWEVIRLREPQLTSRQTPAFDQAALPNRWQPWVELRYAQGATANPLADRPTPRASFADRLGWWLGVRALPTMAQFSFGFQIKW